MIKKGSKVWVPDNFGNLRAKVTRVFRADGLGLGLGPIYELVLLDGNRVYNPGEIIRRPAQLVCATKREVKLMSLAMLGEHEVEAQEVLGRLVAREGGISFKRLEEEAQTIYRVIGRNFVSTRSVCDASFFVKFEDNSSSYARGPGLQVSGLSSTLLTSEPLQDYINSLRKFWSVKREFRSCPTVYRECVWLGGRNARNEKSMLDVYLVSDLRNRKCFMNLFYWRSDYED